YILTYHKLFDGLINNCTAYDNGQCSQCENGYQNNGTSCRDIRENTCDTYSGTTCTKCTTENLLVDNECVSKTSLHCQTSDGVGCTKCSQDYKLSGSTCTEMATVAEKNTARIETCKENSSNTCSLADGRNMTKVHDVYALKNWDTKNELMTFETAQAYCESAGLSLPETSDNICENSFFHSGDSVHATTVWLSNGQNIDNYSCTPFDKPHYIESTHVVCVAR
ncbi:hypothetical protein IJ732_04300, partial [bacterium]|nr:hypothetical protein [bacterium]